MTYTRHFILHTKIMNDKISHDNKNRIYTLPKYEPMFHLCIRVHVFTVNYSLKNKFENTAKLQ